MLDLRKLFLVLAVVALTLGAATTASAQAITCTVTANPLTVRDVGLAELVGDVLMTCTGGTPIAADQPVPVVNITLTLTTNITSRLVADPLTEALLFIDDPQPGSQYPCTGGSGICTPIVSNGAGGAIWNTTSPAPVNIFQGRKQNDNTIVFQGVPLNPPGSGTHLYRIKNVRAAISGFSAPNGQVFGFLSIQNPPANLQLNNASAVVGFVQPGLAFNLRSNSGGGFPSDLTLAQCVDFNKDLATDPTQDYNTDSGGRLFELRYREGYNLAFKRRVVFAGGTLNPVAQDVPQNNYNTESGFYNPLFPSTNGLSRAGLADTGTRLLARFANVPTGVRVYVSAHALGSGSVSTGADWANGGETSSMVVAYGVVADANGASAVFGGGAAFVNPSSGQGEKTPAAGSVPPGANPDGGLVEVPLVGGAGSFTWEIFGADEVDQDTVSFAVTYAYRASSNPPTGTPTVDGSLAPLSTINKMDASAPLPRFASTTSASNAVPLVACQTNLLFPFVTNQAGFDTGMVISNTSADPFGTATQQGTCTLNYYGATAGGGAAPAPQTTTDAIPAGEQLVWLLSGGGNHGIAATPGFQGYIIAQCAFRYAHGYAFISDLGAQRLAQGYLALILDDSAGARTNAVSEPLNQ
jgi:hypothetical protein